MSCLHTNVLLRETIPFSNDGWDAVHFTCLDLEMAFYQVWQNGILYKLYKKGRHQYNIMEKKNGLHQGEPLSSLIFQFLSDNLNHEVQDCSHGVKIYNVEVVSLAFADHLDIISLSTNRLQNMSHFSRRYNRKWRMIFSAPKCIVMNFGYHLDNKQYPLEGEALMEVTFCTNLGKLIFTSQDLNEKRVLFKLIVTNNIKC